MRALSIRQPWAWLIVRPDLVGAARESASVNEELKDIENRQWPTNFRGPILIHAAKGMTRAEYGDAYDFAECLGVELPAFADLERGGIVGQATITDCVDRSASPWFFGRFGFVLKDARPLPFRPLRGMLGFFNVEELE